MPQRILLESPPAFEQHISGSDCRLLATEDAPASPCRASAPTRRPPCRRPPKRSAAHTRKHKLARASESPQAMRAFCLAAFTRVLCALRGDADVVVMHTSKPPNTRWNSSKSMKPSRSPSNASTAAASLASGTAGLPAHGHLTRSKPAVIPPGTALQPCRRERERPALG